MHRRLPITVRVTAVATLVLIAALFGGALLFRRALREAQLTELDSDARQQVEQLSALARAGTVPAILPTTRDSPLLMQVVDGSGKVLGSSPNVSDMHAMVSRKSLRAITDQITRTQEMIDDAYCRMTTTAITVPTGKQLILVAAPVRSVRSADAILRSQLLAFAPLVTIVAAGMLWLIVRRSLRPVDGLRSEVDAISARDLTKRVTAPPVNDEIGRLARTMNALLNRVQNGADRQSRFVSDASHELRSPLAGVRTRLEVGLRNPTGTDWPELAKGVLADNVRMERLVRDLLAVAREDAARPLARSEIDLDDQVMMEVASSRLLGSIPIDTTGVSGGRVVADPDQMRRVVANLLDNAQRFARSKIFVRVQTIDAQVVLSVEDDGPGIPLASRERVFERFARVGEARNREEGGAGLGLAIVREIAGAHGGTTEITEGSTGGACIAVRLPAA